MWNGVTVEDVDGAVRQDGSEKSADDSLGLVGPPDEAVADVEDHERMDLRRHARRRRRELQHRWIARRHYLRVWSLRENGEIGDQTASGHKTVRF